MREGTDQIQKAPPAGMKINSSHTQPTIIIAPGEVRFMAAKSAVFGLLSAGLVVFGQTLPTVHVIVTSGAGSQTIEAERLRSATPETEISHNESAVTDICRNYVDAQRIFQTKHRGASATRIRSTPGRRDGLFWRNPRTVDESPVGPKFAAAAAAEQSPGQANPWFGYYFRMVEQEGGHALIAWPAEYGVSGLRSFMADRFGDVYARDSGAGSHRTAMGMTRLILDSSWKKVASGADL